MSTGSQQETALDPREAARAIRLLVLDVDGVLTDGHLYYSESGHETKTFHIHDGLGIKLLQRAGIEVAIITGRTSRLLERRTRELGIDRVIQGREDKLVALEELLQPLTIEMHQVAYMGDDLPDLAAIRAVGLGMTVANGNPLVRRHARWESRHAGGHGAVREAAEFILDARGELESLQAAYL